ncbi:MAG: hypothetical protein GX589_04300 [Deltaproteobacteria bacterium]|nr:hypothetical protein [Deltaproteobacteria bacterium]
MTQPPEDQQDTPLSQTNYEATPYRDADWEIIGEYSSTKEFAPLQIEAMETQAQHTDPMFADYGGVPKVPGKSRWHLPEHLSDPQFQATDQSESAQDTEDMVGRAEHQAALDEAYARGLQEGRVAAETESKQRRTAFEQRVQTIFSDFQKQISEDLVVLQKLCIDLALQISRKIIDTAVDINPEYIMPVIKNAVSLSGTAAIKNVRISPQDFEFVELMGIAKTFKEYDGSWEFVPDQTIKAGCVVETSAGEIDYQLDEAWDRIKERMVRIKRS